MGGKIASLHRSSTYHDVDAKTVVQYMIIIKIKTLPRTCTCFLQLIAEEM